MRSRRFHKVADFERGRDALRLISESHRAVNTDDSGPDIVPITEVFPVAYVQIPHGVEIKGEIQ
jgi:hypothetical protein